MPDSLLWGYPILTCAREFSKIRIISRITGLSEDAITDIRRRWQRFGITSLRDRPRPRRPPKITKQYRKLLREALRKGPLAYGYIFTTWSIARLNAHLQAATGIKVYNDWLRKLVLAEGFVYRRPKHTLKGERDEAAYQKAKKDLICLKKSDERRCRGGLGLSR